MNKLKGILWGLCLIIVGLIIALNRLEITNINIFFRGWWTLFIIVPSFFGLFDEDGRIISIILFIIGVLLLLNAQRIIDFNNISKLIFPGILVIIGLSILFKNLITNVDVPKVKNEKEYYATFSSEKIAIDGKFDGSDLNAVFGAIDFDLTNAKIKNNAVIKASSIFGSTKIKLPKDVKVELKKVSLFGSTDNNLKKREGKTTIYIESLALFGGVEIK